MQACSTPTFGTPTQTTMSSSAGSAESTVWTPKSLEAGTPRKKYSHDGNDERANCLKSNKWSSLRAPPPARLSLSTNNKSPVSSAYACTPNSANVNLRRNIFSSSIPSTPLSYGKGSFENKDLFSPSITEPVEVEATVEYLADLVKEKKHLSLFPHMFNNVERLLDEEISRVRVELFQTKFAKIDLPEPAGDLVSITEKIYVPKDEFPDYNFVGRILGPRGMTAKQLEQDTGCKIMVRGKGSMRDKSKENSHRGKANWEHLEDELHVLVQCEDTENRVHLKLQAAIEQVKKLLIPAPEGTDELKRKQLMELAIINGTYRPMKSPSRVMTAVPLLSPTPIRSSPVIMPSTPTQSNGTAQAILSPTIVPTSTNTIMGHNMLEYSSLLSPNMFDSFASLQLANDIQFPKYPTTTSFVNTFPSLFTSNSSSPSNNNNSNHSPSSVDSPNSASSRSQQSF